MSTSPQQAKLALPKGFFASWDWKALRVHGKDQEKFLNGLVTNTIKGMAPGENNRSLAMTVKGRIVTESLVVRTEDAFLLWVSPETQAALWEHLDHYHVIEDVSFDWPEVAGMFLGGAGLEERLAAQGLSLPEEGKGCAWPLPDAPSLWATRVALHTPWPTLVVWGSPTHLQTWYTTLEGRGWTDLSAQHKSLFYSLGWYDSAHELKDILIHEAKLEHTHVSFKKGCFIGQEVVARTHWRGKANKGLFLLASDSLLPSLLEEGTPILNQEQKEVGNVRYRQPLLDGKDSLRALLRLQAIENQEALFLQPPNSAPLPLHCLEVTFGEDENEV